MAEEISVTAAALTEAADASARYGAQMRQAAAQLSNELSRLNSVGAEGTAEFASVAAEAERRIDALMAPSDKLSEHFRFRAELLKNRVRL